MPQPLTKKDLKDALKDLPSNKDLLKLEVRLVGRIESGEERLAESIRGTNLSFTQHLSRIEGKIDYIAQNAALRSELRSLVG